MSIEGIKSRWQRDEQLRFVVVGGWNTLFGYAMFLVLYAFLHARVYYLLIGVAAHAVAVVNAFVVHRIVVFRSRRPWPVEFIKFNLAQLFTLCLGLVALWLLVSILRLHPIVGQALVTVISVLISYLVHRHFSFTSQ